jgi:hypothetical protein
LDQDSAAYWSIPGEVLLSRLQATTAGLTKKEARRRLALFSPNLLKSKWKTDILTLLLASMRKP